MLLLVEDRIPPHVEQAVREWRSSNEKGSQVESTAVLRYDNVDGGGEVVARRRSGDRVEKLCCWGVRDVERVVDVDVAVDVVLEVAEDMRL